MVTNEELNIKCKWFGMSSIETLLRVNSIELDIVAFQIDNIGQHAMENGESEPTD